VELTGAGVGVLVDGAVATEVDVPAGFLWAALWWATFLGLDPAATPELAATLGLVLEPVAGVELEELAPEPVDPFEPEEAVAAGLFFFAW